MQLHNKKLNAIKKKGAKRKLQAEATDQPENMSQKIKQTKMQSNQLKQIEKNSEINRENQILLSKLVEISTGKWSSVGGATKGKPKKKKKKVAASAGEKKSLNYG